MLSARRSTIPGRKHKMVYIDLSNPYIRDYLRGFCAAHAALLGKVQGQLGDWVSRSHADEAAEAAATGRAPRPLAATLDIDEVILANIHMNSFQAPAGVQGPDPIDFHAADHYRGPDGRPWPRDDLRLNPLLPGARELLEALRGHGVELYLITGRLESIRAETAENFAFVGLAGEGPGSVFRPGDLASPGGALIMCPDGEYPPPGASVRPYKESRRRAIEASHRIALNVGDQISDLGLYGDVQVHLQHPFYWCP